MAMGQSVRRRGLRALVCGVTTALLAGTMMVLPSASAFAQNATPAEVGRVPGRVDRLERERVVIPEVTAPDVPRYVAPKDADKIKLTLNEIRYEGLEVYTAEQLNARFSDRIGHEIVLSELYKMASELVTFYRTHGYLLTQVVVPPQEIENGVATLRIVPGYIDNVRVEGDAGDHFGVIRRYAENLKQNRPLTKDVMERYLLLINDLPGISARSVLSPSIDTPGAATLRVLVERDRFDYSAQLDNHGSRYLGPVQLTATGQVNSPFGMQEAIGLQVLTTPTSWSDDRELDYFGGYVTLPVGANGTELEFTASKTNTRPGFNLSAFDIKGRSVNFGVTARHPLKRSRDWNLDIFGQFDIANITRSSNLPGGETKDRIRAVRAGLDYERTDRLLGPDMPGLSNFNVTLSQGLGILGETDTVNPTRANGADEFTKMEVELTRLQRLNQWFDIYGGVSAQKSANTLFSAEEFGIGGRDYGRAYDNSEILGEDGWVGLLELRFNPDWNYEHDGNFQFFTWYDIGTVWNRDAITNERESLSSAGAGVRVDVNENVTGEVEIGIPLTRDVDTEGDRGARIFVSLGVKG